MTDQRGLSDNNKNSSISQRSKHNGHEYKRRNESFLIGKRKEDGVKQLQDGVLYEVIEDGKSDKQPTSSQSN